MAKENVEYRRFTSKRRYGVELEVSNNRDRAAIAAVIKQFSEREIRVTDWAQSNGNSYWHVKWDSTCGPKGKGHDNGWEVASFIASGYKDLVHIAEVANAMRKNGIEVTNNCGLHIHADIHDFKPEEAAALVARWIKIEPTLVHAVPLHRHKNKYCKLLGDICARRIDFRKFYDPAKFWRLVRPTNFAVHENNQKKVALNMVNYSAFLSGHQERATVELRLPEGTLFGADVRNWVRCYLNFVDLSQKAGMPTEFTAADDPIEEMMVFFGLEANDKFYILSKGLLEAKTWLLKRLIAFGDKSTVEAATKKLKIVTQLGK